MLSRMPAVSVILATRDRPQLVGRAARSVLDQDYRDLELIVVDDGSAVPARDALTDLEDRRVRFVRADDPLGPAKARNLGLEVAEGTWVGFQDDDDEWLPGKLSRQMDLAARAASEVGVVYGPFLRVGPDGSERAGGRTPERDRGDLLDPLLKGNFVALPAALVRRDCFEAVGRFDPGLGCFEDWELFIRLAARYRFDRVDGPVVAAHESPGSVNQAPSEVQAGAYRRILDRHRAIIEKRPAIHADFLFHIAHHLCLSGELRAGRSYHSKSLSRRPTVRSAITLATTFLGRGIYRALARAYAGSRRAG